MRTQLVIAHALLSDPAAEYQDLGTDYCGQKADPGRPGPEPHPRNRALGYKVTIEPLTPKADPETGEPITRTAS